MMGPLKNLVLCSVAVGLLLPLSGCKRGETKPADQEVAKESEGRFTDWLPRHLFNEFVMERDKAGADGKNYWEKGRCVEVIESRWTDGYQQYRVVIGPAPKDKTFRWVWYFDMEKEFFQKALRQFSMEGYRMVSVAHNTTPSGNDSFAAVWHKENVARPPAEATSQPVSTPAP